MVQGFDQRRVLTFNTMVDDLQAIAIHFNKAVTLHIDLLPTRDWYEIRVLPIAGKPIYTYRDSDGVSNENYLDQYGQKENKN